MYLNMIFFTCFLKMVIFPEVVEKLLKIVFKNIVSACIPFQKCSKHVNLYIIFLKLGIPLYISHLFYFVYFSISIEITHILFHVHYKYHFSCCVCSHRVLRAETIKTIFPKQESLPGYTLRNKPCCSIWKFSLIISFQNKIQNRTK